MAWLGGLGGPRGRPRPIPELRTARADPCRAAGAKLTQYPSDAKRSCSTLASSHDQFAAVHVAVLVDLLVRARACIDGPVWLHQPPSWKTPSHFLLCGRLALSLLPVRILQHSATPRPLISLKRGNTDRPVSTLQLVVAGLLGTAQDRGPPFLFTFCRGSGFVSSCEGRFDEHSRVSLSHAARTRPSGNTFFHLPLYCCLSLPLSLSFSPPLPACCCSLCERSRLLALNLNVPAHTALLCWSASLNPRNGCSSRRPVDTRQSWLPSTTTELRHLPLTSSPWLPSAQTSPISRYHHAPSRSPRPPHTAQQPPAPRSAAATLPVPAATPPGASSLPPEICTCNPPATYGTRPETSGPSRSRGGGGT